MAAAGAVSGMPEGAAASLPSAFLPGAAKRSHRLGSRPVPARSRAPEPPPGSPSRARSRSPSPRLEISLPSPLAGMVTGPQLGHSWVRTAQGSGDTPQGAGAHPPSLFPAPPAFTAPSCRIPFVRLCRRPIAPTSDPPTTPRQWTRGQRVAGHIPEGGDASWGSRGARVSPCSGGFPSLLSPSAGGTGWAGALREAAESGSNQGFSAGRAA